MWVATGFAKITWNETKTPQVHPHALPMPRGGVPKPLMQVKRLGSWGRVCPKVINLGDQVHILGRNLWKLQVQELDRASSPKFCSWPPQSSPPPPLAVATKAIISLFLEELIN